MTPVPLAIAAGDCWNTIGVHGDRSCPELAAHVHCHNCPVFAAAGRKFLDAPSPPEYVQEWTERLAGDCTEAATAVVSLLVFRVADEWLALPVRTLVEVATPRRVHRIPRHAGLLAGIVNIRGELHLCVRFAKLLGIATAEPSARSTPPADDGKGRLLVARRDADTWVFPVDAVDRVCRVAEADMSALPATVARASAHLARGVFRRDGRMVGLLDEEKVFEALRRRLR